jgi:hypothetical protein
MRKIASLAPLALLVLIGCKQGPSMVGTWKAVDNGKGAFSGDFVINDDKTFTLSTNQMGMTLNGKGTWTADDKSLTLTPTEAKLDNVSSEIKMLAKAKGIDIDAMVNAQLNKPRTGPYTWKTDDEFTWTADGVNATFDRVKKS